MAAQEPEESIYASGSTTSTPATEALQRERNQQKSKKDIMSFKERWAIKANAFEWLITVPNLSVEFDLSDTLKKSNTISLTVKCNWNTYHKYLPPSVFNMFDVRPEFRHYYRTSSYTYSDRSSRSKRQKFEDFVLDHERKDPKTWRAYYIGGYVNYGTYAFKFTETGIQGIAVGLGASLGYAIPMYIYEKGKIDVELGFSVGFQMCTKDRFIHDPDGHYYLKLEDKSKGFHFTPFPVVSELRVAFAYRFLSIKDKYPYDADEKRMRQTAREDARLAEQAEKEMEEAEAAAAEAEKKKAAEAKKAKADKKEEVAKDKKVKAPKEDKKPKAEKAKQPKKEKVKKTTTNKANKEKSDSTTKKQKKEKQPKQKKGKDSKE